METSKVRKINPITPREASKEAQSMIPDWVIDGINDAIKEKFVTGRSFRIKQKELMLFVMKNAPKGMTKQRVFDYHWMDFEKLYGEFGWKVKYDRPAYREDFEPIFEFTPKPDKEPQA